MTQRLGASGLTFIPYLYMYNIVDGVVVNTMLDTEILQRNDTIEVYRYTTTHRLMKESRHDAEISWPDMLGWCFARTNFLPRILK